jgi:hypothetical protein
LPVAPVQLIKQLAAAGIGQGFEDNIHEGDYMQPFGCMSSFR